MKKKKRRQILVQRCSFTVTSFLLSWQQRHNSIIYEGSVSGCVETKILFALISHVYSTKDKSYVCELSVNLRVNPLVACGRLPCSRPQWHGGFCFLTSCRRNRTEPGCSEENVQETPQDWKLFLRPSLKSLKHSFWLLFKKLQIQFPLKTLSLWSPNSF